MFGLYIAGAAVYGLSSCYVLAITQARGLALVGSVLAMVLIEFLLIYGALHL